MAAEKREMGRFERVGYEEEKRDMDKMKGVSSLVERASQRE